MAQQKKQIEMFDTGEWWEDDWQGMPEFIQNDLTLFKTVMVHFKEPIDLEAFSLLIGQKINHETKYVWYPKQEIKKVFDTRYVDGGEK